jgi:hypothetical protein
MKETVSTTEVRRKLGDLLDRVDLSHDPSSGRVSRWRP